MSKKGKKTFENLEKLYKTIKKYRKSSNISKIRGKTSKVP